MLECLVCLSRCPWAIVRGCHGGVEKEGGGKPHEWHPSQKGVPDPPPRTVRCPPLSGVRALFFLYKNPRQSRLEALLEGVQKCWESAFSGTLSSPPYVLHPPPTSRPNIAKRRFLANPLGPKARNWISLCPSYWKTLRCMEWWWMDLPDFRPWILEFHGLKFQRLSASNQQNKGFYWKIQP